MPDPRLEILICTCGPEGASRVEAMHLPEIEEAGWLVSWQQSEDAPVPAALAARADVRVVRNEAKCLSENRNAAFEAARGELLLIADDDLSFNPDALGRLIGEFDARPDVDVITLRHEGASKAYPDGSLRLTPRLPKGYYVSSIEIALRRRALAAEPRLRFCPELGLGTPLGCGEEEVFLQTALRLGRVVEFVPLTVCSHPGETSGSSRRMAPHTLRGFGATIALVYPLSAPLRIPLKALRLSRSGRAGFFRSLRLMTAGAIRGALTIRQPWRK